MSVVSMCWAKSGTLALAGLPPTAVFYDIFFVFYTPVMVAVAILGTGASVPRRPVSEFGTGIIAGTMGMVASMGGPPAALLFKDEKGPTIRASLSMFFSGGLLITAIVRLFAGRITWDDVVSGERKTYERNIYLHRDRTTMMIFSVAEEVV